MTADTPSSGTPPIPDARAEASPPALPAGPVRLVCGTAIALVGDDIDTDRIVPARFLKCVTFEGLGQWVFADDRAERGGDHPFDRPERQGASILLVNRNFGCGSSREHAPQALMRWGIRAVIGESFAEIFFGNCLALGIPCLLADQPTLRQIQAASDAAPAALFRLDLEALALLQEPEGPSWPLQLEQGPRRMLLSGQWDGTAQLLAHDSELTATAARLPYLSGFAAVS